MPSHTLLEKIHKLSWVLELNHMQEAKRHKLKGRVSKGIGLVGLHMVKVERSMLKEQVEERMVRDT